MNKSQINIIIGIIIGLFSPVVFRVILNTLMGLATVEITTELVNSSILVALFWFSGIISIFAFVVALIKGRPLMFIKVLVALVANWTLLIYFGPFFRWIANIFAIPQILNPSNWLLEEMLLIVLLWATWMILFPSLRKKMEECGIKAKDCPDCQKSIAIDLNGKTVGGK